MYFLFASRYQRFAGKTDGGTEVVRFFDLYSLLDLRK
jgi:hypothetical protein